MAVRLRKDGRWTVYFRGSDSRQVEEYFGHGPEAEARAYQRDADLGLQRRRLRLDHSGPTFLELAKEYRDKKDFNENSRLQLRIRVEKAGVERVPTECSRIEGRPMVRPQSDPALGIS
jgi:hypothetical protein